MASMTMNAKPDRYSEIVARFPPRDRTLSKIIEHQAKRNGERILFKFRDVQWTYRQTMEIAGQWASHLSEAGILPGDRVAIVCGNRPEFLKIYLGCAWLGAIAVPINPALRGGQLGHVLNNSTPKLLVTEVIHRSIFETLPKDVLLPPINWSIEDSGVHDSHGNKVDNVAITISESKAGPADTVAILYTSGTTGPSKGVCCPQAQLFWWGIYSGRGLGLLEGDVLLTTLPLFHTNALNAFYQAMLNDCTYVLEPKFSASAYWRTLRENRVTVAYLLGAMAAILLAQPPSADDRGHNVRVALGGGVPDRFHPAFLDRYGVPLVDGYASTETNFVFASPIPSDHPGAMGYLVPGAKASIVDEDETPVPDGVAGELLLRPVEPYSFATGYFNMHDKTVEAWRNLWFHTGDRVVRESDGHYRFIDRVKDAIRRRGENISSWEVEQVLMEHPSILACAVYAVPSDLGEDEVAAAIQLKAGHAFDPVGILSFCENHLAYFAVPRYLRTISEMPLTENGKIKKLTLRAAGITQDIWDREAFGYKLRR